MGSVICATPDCREPATKLWGVDEVPACAACYAEIEVELAALQKEIEARDETLAKQRVD